MQRAGVLGCLHDLGLLLAGQQGDCHIHGLNLSRYLSLIFIVLYRRNSLAKGLENSVANMFLIALAVYGAVCVDFDAEKNPQQTL